MKKIFFVGLCAILCMSFQNVFAQTKRPEVGNVCKVYTGYEGIRISTCRVGPVENNEVLIGIMGIDHPWNSKIFKAKVNKYNGKEDYEIKVNGKPYVLITYRDYYMIYLTPYGTTKEEQYIWYNKDASSECKPEWLLTEYLEQEAREQK